MVSTAVNEFVKFYGGRADKLALLGAELDLAARRSIVAHALDEFLLGYNVTKMTLAEFEMLEGMPNATLLAATLLQRQTGVDLGICPAFKMWRNRQGEQERCGLVPVYHYARCAGLWPRCDYLRLTDQLLDERLLPKVGDKLPRFRKE